jgi:hypothetical protein
MEPPPPRVSLTQPRGARPAGQMDPRDDPKGPELLLRNQRENPAQIHRLLTTSPRDADLLHRMFTALQRAEDVDRRWCIAHALVFLGEATDEEREHDLGLVRPSRAVNDDEWRELLFHPDEDLLTGEILAAIAPAALLGVLTTLRSSIAPMLLDARHRIDPHSSTIQAVRCVTWTAAVLGLEVPPIYVCHDHEGLADIVLSPTPAIRLGEHAVSGRSSKELAFVAARQLSWYRREHLLGRPTRSLRRLEDMFLAALFIGNPGLPMAEGMKKRVEPLARAIRPLLDKGDVERLERAFSQFVEQGGRTNLARWYAASERTSAAAGLLLCNDLGSAKSMLALEASLEPQREPGGVEAALDDLVVFFTATRCSMLRKRIGIAVT